MSSADCGSSAPYATTGQQSGASSRSASWNSGSRGWSGLEHRYAELLAALGDRAGDQLAAAARGRVGAGDDADQLVAESAIASSAGSATSGVPAKTTLTEPSPPVACGLRP